MNQKFKEKQIDRTIRTTKLSKIMETKTSFKLVLLKKKTKIGYWLHMIKTNSRIARFLIQVVCTICALITTSSQRTKNLTME